MSEDKHGILPKFKILTEAFKQLISEIEPLLENKTKLENFTHIKNILENIYNKMKELPIELNHSYEMIQTVIESIHDSRNELKKSVDGLIKKTGVQLKKITSTTEEATNKIMDAAEKLDDEQNKMIEIIDELLENNKLNNNDKLSIIKETILQNQDLTFQIMDFLQFQDITAQQISGAYSLLADTEKTLIQVSAMLLRFDNSTLEIAGNRTEIDKNSFNADASFNNKDRLQDEIDDLFNKGTKEGKFVTENDDKNNEDVDMIFNKNNTQVRQDDINNLFEDENKKEDVSQDDIDALFS